MSVPSPGWVPRVGDRVRVDASLRYSAASGTIMEILDRPRLPYRVAMDLMPGGMLVPFNADELAPVGEADD